MHVKVTVVEIGTIADTEASRYSRNTTLEGGDIVVRLEVAHNAAAIILYNLLLGLVIGAECKVDF